MYLFLPCACLNVLFESPGFTRQSLVTFGSVGLRPVSGLTTCSLKSQALRWQRPGTFKNHNAISYILCIFWLFRISLYLLVRSPMYKEDICYILFRIPIFLFFNVIGKRQLKIQVIRNKLYLYTQLKFLRALPSSLLFLRTLIYSLVGNSSSARLQLQDLYVDRKGMSNTIHKIRIYFS